jgi:amino acid adenylation domain-containing protein
MSKQNVQDIYPLSPSQQSMLVYLLVSGSRSEVYFDQYVATLGPVDPETLRRAWKGVVERHPALRTLFVWDKRDQPLQIVRREVDLPWQEHDWRELPEADREERLAAVLRADLAQGFDLGKAPLLRVAVIRWTDDLWKMVWSFSHLILDGWSMALILSEVTALYTAALEGREAALAPAPSYREYIGWIKRQDPARAEEYWRRTLAGFEPPTPLPLDGTGGPRASGWAAAETEHILPAETVRRIQELARQAQITPAALFQGVWGLLLGRWGGLEEVVYGSISSGRPYELDGVESMVGMFISALPVRLRVDPVAPLLPWLRRVQADQFEQREFEHSSQEQITVWSGVSRHAPLFESILVYENYPFDPLGRGDDGRLEVRDARLTEANNFPLTLYLAPRGKELALKLSYHWSRFGDAEAERLLAGVGVLLEGVLERPEARLGDLPLLSRAERLTLIAAAAGPPAEPAAIPIDQLVAEQTARTPDAVAIASVAGDISYRELDRSATRLAHRLRALGVNDESLVAVCAERSPEMVVALLAVLRAGGAYLPLDPDWPAERLSFMLADSGTRALLTQERVLSRTLALLETRPRLELLDGVLTAGETDAGLAIQETAVSHLAYVIYTSGSTGKPKGVQVAHASLARYVGSAASAFGLGPGDRVLQFASVSFDTSAEEIWPCLTRGATLVLRDDTMTESLDRFAREVARRGITVLDLPTAYWHELVAEMESTELELPASLRLVILGGEQAQRDRYDAWRRRVGDRIRLLNTYGPTEATIVTTRRELSGESASGFPGDVPIGRPIEGARVFIADPGQQILPAGVDGELLIGGSGLARGYLGRPELTAERFVPDPFSGEPGARLYRSGDLARQLPGGDLQFRGRTDHQVKIRGYRIELGEIEAALRAVPGVRDAVVVARAARDGGQRLIAWVVPREGSAPTTAELRSSLRERLPDYMIPSAFSFLAELPSTPGGKVDRRAVTRLDTDDGRPDLGTDYTAPRTPTEEMLVEIWSDLLGAERVGVHDDFFQLGGHSLLVARLASRVRQAFQVELPMVEVFRQPTVAALAAAVERAERAQEVPELPPIRRTPRDRPIPLSYPQERVWVLDQLSAGGNLAYNFQVTIWLRGLLDVDALRASLQEIVRRHEVLRTSFPTVNGSPVQVIHPPGPIEFPVIDLRHVPAEERHEVSERLVAETIQVPFELSRVPLIRWRLLRLEDDVHELVQVEHHFVHDGWSFAVLLRELKALYPELAAGRPSPLPEPPIQYADFAAWQRGWMEGPVMDHMLAYWRGRLAGSPGILELPTDRPRPARQTFRGEVEMFLIPPSLYQDLRQYGRRHGFTLYMVMAAGFLTLLHRYTGQEDILLGTSNANRRSREMEGMIGMVVNSLVLRGDLAGDPPFRGLLERVRQVTLEAYSHQDMPFERLVQELRPERQLGRNPLFQVMFNFHDAAVPDLEIGDLRGSFLVRGNRSSKMDMNVIIIPRAEQRVGQEASEADRRAILHWEYSTELFDASTMHRMVQHYLNLLADAVATPERRLGDLAMLTEGELLQLAGWSERRGFPSGTTLPELFAAQAARTPGAPAVVLGDERLTYSDLDRRSDRLARRLRGMGVEPGVPVALCAGRSPALLVGILGILKAGGGYVPLDPAYPAERLGWILEDSQRALENPLLVAESAAASLLPPHRARLVLLEGLDAEAGDSAPLPPVAGPDDLAYVIYTSGSTGRPKGVPISHRQVVRLFAATRSWFDFGREDAWTLFHSFAFDFSVWEIWGALLHGGRLVVVPAEVSRTTEAFLDLLMSEQVTILNQTPSAFRQLIAAEETRIARGGAPEDLALREVVFGGEALEIASLRPWIERHGDRRPRLVNMYGITETTVHVTYRPITVADLEQGLSGRIGRPIPDLAVHLADRDGNMVPAGVPGEILVAGAGLSPGYLHRPELTAARFIPDPFGLEAGGRLYRSGDLARWRPDGDLEYLGRIDHQVKVRGFRIELGEIEATLARLPEIREAVVLARQDRGETRLVAWLVPANGAPLDVLELRRELKRWLPDYMIPAVFLAVDAIPLTAHGKLDRAALPDPDGERTSPIVEHVAPRTSEEETLAQIWSEVLGIERIGVHDDFFALGGHSLSAARVLARVRDALGVKLPLAALFELPTLEALAAEVASLPRQEREAPLAVAPAPADPASANLSDDQLDSLLAELMQERQAPTGLPPEEKP